MAEQKLAELERWEACKCFASGMAAISATLVNSLKWGDHVL
ncbi:PLP-dependent transferase [Terribacillus saccharophilus]